jgi:uncharacterized protein (UPF0254 family)
MIRVATAECFTHGMIARELHLRRKRYGISVVCGLFLPTLESLRVLGIKDLPKPVAIVDGIKIYDEEGDKIVAFEMARRVMEMFKTDVGIGSSAGIGRGCVAVVSKHHSIYAKTDVYANFLTSDEELILKRHRSGVEKALKLFEIVWRGLRCSSPL